MASEQKIVLEIVVKNQQAKQATEQTKRSFVELNQAVELAKTAFRGAQVGFDALASTLERGGAIAGLSKNFDRLNQAAGVDSVAAMRSLQSATQGLVSNFDLLKQSNQALTLGLTPDQFNTAAEAATKLSVSLGLDVTQGIESVVTGLGRQSRLMLDNLGIIVKQEEANQAYASSLGKTTEQLTEAERKTAFMAAAMEALDRASQNIDTTVLNAGQAATVASNEFQNLTDEIARGVAESPELAEAFLELKEALEEVDVDALTDALISLTGTGVKLTTWATDLISGLSEIGNEIVNGLAKDVMILMNLFKEGSFSKAIETTEAQLRLTKEINKENERRIQIERVANKVLKIQSDLNTEGLETLEDWKEALELVTEGQKRRAELARRHEEILQGEEEARKRTAKAIRDQAEALEELNAKLRNEQDVFGAGFGGTLGGGNFGRAIEDLIPNVQEATNELTQGGLDFTVLIREGLEIAGQEFDIGLTGSANDFLGTLIDGLGSLDLGGLLGDSSVGGLFGEGGLGGLLQGVQANISGPGGLGSLANPIFAAISLAASTSAGTLGNFIDSGGTDIASGVGTAVNTIFPGAGSVLETGLSAIGVNDMFGGNDPEGEARQAFIDSFSEQFGDSFNLLGSGGRQGFEGEEGFNVNFGDEASGRLVGFTNAITQALGFGQGKAQEDISGLFLNLVDGLAQGEEGAINFNEALANVLGLMDQLNMSAEQGKDALTQQFLDGAIALDQFGAGLENMSVLAQENLVGTGSISDALNILANNFDNPRNQLQALELLFTEAREIGAESIGDLGDIIEQRLGIDAGDVFERLEAAGISSFEDLSSRSGDEIFLILSTINDLRGELETTFSDGFGAAASAAQSAADIINQATGSIQSSLGGVKDSARQAADAIGNLNNVQVRDPVDINANLGAPT